MLVGLMGKFFGPVGLAFGVATGEARPEGLITCLTNDLIWWIPFTLILLAAWRHESRLKSENRHAGN